MEQPSSIVSNPEPVRRVVTKRPSVSPPTTQETSSKACCVKACCLGAHGGAPWIVGIVVIAAFVYFAVVGFPMSWSKSWQAVFLTNGQVYFGHIVRNSFKTIVIRDVYYLQTTPSLQQGQQPTQPDITLVKLGNELHAPTDEMRINREHVLFTEALKDDGTVAQGIMKAREGGAAAPAAEQPPANAPAEKSTE